MVISTRRQFNGPHSPKEILLSDLESRLDAIAGSLASDVCDWFPSWREARQLLPAITAAIKHGLGTYLRLLREERPHTHAELDRVTNYCLPPVGSGVTLEDLLQSLLVAFDRIWDELQVSIRRVPNVEPEFFLAVGRIGHGFFCELMLNLNRRYLDSDRRLWIRAEEAQQRLVELLLVEPASDSDAAGIAPAIGLDLSSPLAVSVVERSASDVDVADLAATLRAGVRPQGRAAAVAVIGGRAVVLGAEVEGGTFAPVSFRVGVGRAGIGPSGLRRSYQEATEALETARARGLPSLRYDLGWFERFLAGRLPPSALAEELLRDIHQLPDRKRASALATLEAYLDSGGSIVETAARLHLHPQSVRYRLARLKEQLTVDLESPEARLALHVALKYQPPPDEPEGHLGRGAS